ncbi:hypothetical protein TcasGA2_TC033727 [Tribolium castaneum]|uniref:Uncharacterized protein n=1 Tax=Tribolium castaneum TaxID=7070 RepID=A0A139WEV7_TRICA|nr:hypothetical protein TcasGA2_TC033727 [Tribolium castaneum]
MHWISLITESIVLGYIVGKCPALFATLQLSLIIISSATNNTMPNLYHRH